MLAGHRKSLYLQPDCYICALINDLNAMPTPNGRFIPALLLALFALLFSAGCGRKELPDAGRLSIEEWMREEPDSCMWYYTDLYLPLGRAGRYDSLEQIYGRILRAMPDPVPGDPDSLAYIAGWVTTFYYNVRMLQEKTDGGARLTDSLAASPNPFYASTLQPELLSVTAKFYVEEGRIDRVDSLGRKFERLAPTGNPMRDIRAWHDMAWAIEYCDLSTARAIALEEHALDLFRRGMRGNGDWEVLTQMGRLCFKNGDYLRAAELIQEGIGWMTEHADTPGDGLINAYNDLVRLYTALGLYDKALEASGRAAERSEEAGGWLLDEVYRLRAACFNEAGQPDSALRWTEEAEKALPSDAAATLLLSLRLDRLKYYMAAHPGSAGHCLEQCRLLLGDTARMEPEWRADWLALYGQSLLQTAGREGEGIACLERAYRDFRFAGRPAKVVRLAEQLVGAYIGRRLPERLEVLYPDYAALRDSLWHERNLRAAVGANIRYETGRKEQENRALAAEVGLKEQKLKFNRLAGGGVIGVLLLLMAGAAVYMYLSRRYYRVMSGMQLLRISNLLDEQKVWKEQNERLEHELEAAGADKPVAPTEEQPPVGEQPPVATDWRKEVGNMRSWLGKTVLKADEEARFRRSFMAVFPHYLADLRQACPDLTRTDELIAMLLRLGLGNNEIALAMGVTKAGVNKARTRMRRRLGLADTGTVLEEFLCRFG